ncbi:efflux transporter outer membrane subunit [Massilia sp. IC2-278]|uniref:efflux transporter outer membrane subunit n=1 Tax=Massilia sp. IC2-278 TaxID=2887200 RepID=UPI001E5CA4C3|nr:efflux transporter outer membrane subunit [Massilia sp. IC2-278]MCC2960553.1 efflux transporter outer membrane subunit [Massilia sp. IC2-278]
MSLSFPLRAGVLACLFALSACTLGPDFHRPESAPAVASFATAGAAVSSHTVEQALDASWWKLFQDPLLVELEREAIDANLDLQAAAARVAQSRAALQVSGAALLPSVDAGASYARQRASGKGTNALSGATDQHAFNLSQAGVDASWELDLWGRARRLQESSAAQLEAAGFDAAAMRVSLTAEVARVYLELRGVQNDLRVARSNSEIAAKSLHVAERRRSQGVATAFDTSVARAQLASFEAAIPELEARADALSNALALLLAKPPRALDAQLGEAAELPGLPARVPVGLPSELAHRRPDILGAESRLHAATAQIGAAQADFYPRISLTGSLGAQALSFSDLGWGARQFAIGPSLHLPVFEGGRLKGELALTEARQQEAAIAYRQTVLKAWHEVDNALSSYRRVQQRAAQLDVAVLENRRALTHAERRYAQGAADYLTVLVTQQRLLDSENAASRGRTDTALAMVALYKALGGGWEAAQ